ncbi:hypothetical protein HDU80_002486, partial [Chytriomyces hyalinus]
GAADPDAEAHSDMDGFDNDVGTVKETSSEKQGPGEQESELTRAIRLRDQATAELIAAQLRLQTSTVSTPIRRDNAAAGGATPGRTVSPKKKLASKKKAEEEKATQRVGLTVAQLKALPTNQDSLSHSPALSESARTKRGLNAAITAVASKSPSKQNDLTAYFISKGDSDRARAEAAKKRDFLMMEERRIEREERREEREQRAREWQAEMEERREERRRLQRIEDEEREERRREWERKEKAEAEEREIRLMQVHLMLKGGAPSVADSGVQRE